MTYPFSRRLTLSALLLLMLTIATGCVATRTGVSWPSVSLVGEQNYILLAYNNFIVQINPTDGSEVQLRNEDGDVRVNPETGEARTWDLEHTALQAFYSSPVLIDDTTLLVAEYDKKFVFVDYTTARIDNPAGRAISGNVVADIAFDDERYYVPYNSRNVEAFDRETLNAIWLFETQSDVWAKPLVHDGVVYFTSTDHFLYAVDAETGEQLWRQDLGGAAAGTPALYDGGTPDEPEDDRLYVGTFARTVREFTLRGEATATFETTNWVWGAPAVVDGVAYAADLSGFVYALRVPGLEQEWAVQASPSGIRASPVVFDDFVITASRSGRVSWLDRRDGSEVQARELENNPEVLSDLLIVPAGSNLREPLILITTVEPRLVAFTAREGRLAWQYQR